MRILVVGDEIDFEDLEEDSGHDDRPNGGSSRDHIGVRCNDDIVEDSWEGSMSMRTEDMCLSPEVNTRVSMIMTRPMTIILKRVMIPPMGMYLTP